MMDDILEMLKLLDYENKFCRQKYENESFNLLKGI